MSDERPLEPLPEDLRDLLAAERRRPEMPPELSDRVLDRIRERVANDGPPPARSAAGHPVATILAGVGGVIVGAALHARFQAPPPPRAVTVERVVERRVEVPVVRYVTATVDGGAVVPDTVATRARSPVTSPPRSATLNDDDSALVERARTALLRGSLPDALAALQEHARRFPRGQFTEEREALAVQTLVALRRHDEARARAAAFHRRFPQSALGAAVDAATRQIPEP